MKIINAHVHAIDVQGMLTRFPNASVQGGIASLSHLRQALPLLDPKVILEQMDDAGIEQSVLYAVDAPIVYAANDYVAGLCRQHPDRFIGFGSANPHEKSALDTLKKAVDEYRMQGIKFHPPLQNFFPNDEKVFPIYAAAQEWKVPIVFHVGSTPFGSMCKLSQANPILLDEVAVAFPDLRIMLTHLGTLWDAEAFMVVEKNPNVFIDTAAYLHEIKALLTEDLVARVGEDKIIFGTDFPMPSPPHKLHCMKAFVTQVQQLQLSQEIKEKIFAGNFQQMLSPVPKKEDEGLSIQDVIKSLQ